MNTVQRIAKNIGVFGLSQIFSSMFAFLLMIFVARFLGETEFGQYSFVITFAGFFVVFADLGISELITREIARKKELTNKYVSNALVIKFLLSFITIILISIAIHLLNFNQEIINLVYIFSLYFILNSFSLLFMSIFKAYEKLEYNSLVLTVEKFFLLASGFIVLNLGFGINELSYVYLFAGLLDILITSIIFYEKINQPSFNINFKIWKPLITQSIPFSINTLFTILFFRADIILLSLLKGDTAVGIYTAAFNPILSLSVIISSMTVAAIYPVMSRYFIDSKNLLEKITLLSSKYMIIIGIPIAFGSIVLSDKLIYLFYGGAFTESILVFQILCLFIPIRLVSSITGTLLTSANKQGIRSFSFVFCALLNILLNLFFIPYLSYIGASIVTVLSEIFLYFLFIFYIKKYYVNLNFKTFYIKPILATIIMVLVLFNFKWLNLPILIIMGIFVYFTSLIILKGFTNEDKEMFNRLISKKVIK